MQEIRLLTLSLSIRLHTGVEYLKGLPLYALYELEDDYTELARRVKER